VALFIILLLPHRAFHFRSELQGEWFGEKLSPVRPGKGSVFNDVRKERLLSAPAQIRFVSFLGMEVSERRAHCSTFETKKPSQKLASALFFVRVGCYFDAFSPQTM
jgi:hypothetical protein